ncbi:MAG TPA: hypothetical protein VD861_09705, partial [Pyrinomonadaceae bacterium]|nr:hypothetical protein [Pyrinomonadaceae bacterium]
KRFFGVVMCLVLLSATVGPALAQGYRGRYAGRATTYRRYDDWQRRSYYGRRYDNRSFWERHRDKLTVAGGAGAGAAVGAMVGGKKGAIIGALLGAGGSALYTYKLRDRNNRRYYRRW